MNTSIPSGGPGGPDYDTIMTDLRAHILSVLLQADDIEALKKEIAANGGASAFEFTISRVVFDYAAMRCAERQEELIAQQKAMMERMERQSKDMARQSRWMLRLTWVLAVAVAVQIALAVVQIVIAVRHWPAGS